MKMIGNRMLTFIAFMNLALYMITRLWVLPHLVWGQPFFISIWVLAFAFQFNWVVLMVAVFWQIRLVTKLRKGGAT